LRGNPEALALDKRFSRKRTAGQREHSGARARRGYFAAMISAVEQ
jgi:hypothetical protein